MDEELMKRMYEFATSEDEEEVTEEAPLEVEVGSDLEIDTSQNLSGMIDSIGEKASAMFTDTADAVAEWNIGTKQAVKELKTANAFRDFSIDGEEIPADNPTARALAMNDVYMPGYDESKSPYLTDAQKDATKWSDEALGKFMEDSVKPAAILLASLGLPIGEKAFMPFMAEDIAKSVEGKGAVDTAVGVGEGITGVEAFKMLGDKDFQAYADQHPGRAVAQFIGSALAPLQTIVKPAFNATKKYRSNKTPKEETSTITEQKPVEDLTVPKEEPIKSKAVDEGIITKDFLDKADEAPKKATDTSTPVDEITKIYKEEADTFKVENDEVQALWGIKGSGRDIETAPVDYPHTVSQLDLKKALNDITTFRVGMLRGVKDTVGGYYERISRGIRSKEHGEYGVAAHEVGHFLDAELGIKGHDQELVRNAEQVWGAGQYKKKAMRGEGIAEFTREYVLNPKEAQKNFPRYYDSFVKALDNSPELKAKLERLSTLTRKWYTQSPEARVSGSIVQPGDAPKLSLRDVFSAAKDDAYTAVVDKFHPLQMVTDFATKKMVKKLMADDNPYVKAQMAKNISSSRADMLIKGNASDIKVLKQIYGENVIKNDVTFHDVAKALDHDALEKAHPEYLKNQGRSNWVEAFDTYLTSRRLIEVEKKMLAKKEKALNEKLDILEKMQETIDEGADPEVSTKIESDIAKTQRKLEAVQRGEGYNKPVELADAEATLKNAPIELKHAAVVYDEFNENFVNLAEHYGFLQKGGAAFLREENGSYSPLSRSFLEENLGQKSHPTSNDKIVNIKDLYHTLDEDGSTRLINSPMAKTQEMIQRLVKNGEQNLVGISVTKLAQQPGMSDLAMKVGRAGADSDKNVFYVWEGGKKVAYQAICPELVEIIKMPPKTASHMMSTISAGVSATLRYTATNNPAFWAFNVMRDTMMATALNPNKKAFIPFWDTASGVYTLLTDKQMVSEFKAAGVTRTTLASETVQIGKDLAQATGYKKWKIAKPIDVAVAILDGYNKVGQVLEESTRMAIFKQARKEGASLLEAGNRASDTTTNFSRSGSIGQSYNRHTTFFNAGVQGLDKIGRTLKASPVKTMTQITYAITAPSMALWAYNHNEEWYKKTPPDIKNKFWLFKAGDSIVRIPKPEGIGYIFGSMPERLAEYCIDHNTGALPTVAGFAKDLSPNLLPQALKPLGEVWMNKNIYTWRNILNNKDLGLPKGQQYDLYTTEFAKAVAQKTPVGNVLSPKQIDHLCKGYFSTFYDMGAGAVDNMIGTETVRPAKKLREYPGLSRFFHDPERHTVYVDDFFNGLNDMKVAHNGKGKNATKKGVYQNMEADAKVIEQLSKDLYEVRDRKNISAEQKRRVMDAKSAKIAQIAKKSVMKNLNRRY